jgi:hypothetical protein
LRLLGFGRLRLSGRGHRIPRAILVLGLLLLLLA